MQSDDNLIRRAQNGDLEAFEEIVHRYDRRVLALTLRYTQDEDEAKDVYQEIFMRVHRALPKFRFRSRFSTWLHRIAVNACHTHRRRSQRERIFSLDEPVETSEGATGAVREMAADEANSEDRVFNRELSRQIRAALEDLSPRQRLVFILRHYHDFKLREIAAMLRCAEGTVKRHLFAATHRMRQRLQSELNEGV